MNGIDDQWSGQHGPLTHPWVILTIRGMKRGIAAALLTLFDRPWSSATGCDSIVSTCNE